MDGLGLVLVISLVLGISILIWLKTPKGKKWLASL